MGRVTAQRSVTPVLVVLVLACLPWPNPVHGQAQPQACRLRFVVDEALSLCALTGNNALVPPRGANLNAPITAVANSVRPNFQGALHATFPSAAGCPTTLPELARGLSSAAWLSNGTDYPHQASAGPFRGIAVWPARISGTTAGQTYQPQNLLWNLTSNATTISPVNNTHASITIRGLARLLQGWLWTENILTGNRYDNIAPGDSGSFSGTGWLSLQDNVSTIRFVSFNLSLTAVGSLLIGSTNYTSITTLNFNGNMSLSAGVSCPVYCGDYGRCAIVNGTAGCQCECGWRADRTGACRAPGGYCPVFGATSANGTCSINVASSDPPAPPADTSVTLDAALADEGAADVYRPIVSFIPVVLQLACVACLLLAMLSARSWTSAARQRALVDDSKPSAPRPVAEGATEDVADSHPAADQQRDALGLPVGNVQVVLQLPAYGTWGPQQEAAVGSALTLTFESVSAWVAPGLAAALTRKGRRAVGGPEGSPGRGHKRILTEVSGQAAAGKLVGLLGPSGSGKSTLLNVLSGQVQAGGRWDVVGRLCVGGQPVSAPQLSRMCAHVPQHDLLLPGLTVEECLRYAAAVRLPRAAKPAEGAARVESLLAELRIAHIRSAYGGSSSGSMAISGGERQRVSLGMELVADSRLLLLDEPTSGLDSYNALSLMRMLSRVAQGTGNSRGSGPRIVVASVHQPSPALFALLDEVLLLANGRRVFAGPPSAAPDAFAMLGAPCPPSASIAEHMLTAVADPELMQGLMDRLGQGVGAGQGVGQLQGTTQWPGAVASGSGPICSVAFSGADSASTDSPASADAAGEAGARPANGAPSTLHRPSVSAGPLAFFRKPGVLFWRSVVRLQRDPTLFAMHVAGAIVMGILVGFVFFNTQKETTGGVIGRLGTIFFTVNVVAFPALSAMDSILDERQVVERELARGYYSPATYMITKLVMDGLLLRAIPSAMYATPFYWIMGLRSDATAFTIFLGVIAGFTALISALVLLLTNLLGSPGRILVATTTLLLIFALFAGFLANANDMHWALRWITYVSPFRWAWQALVVNELRPLLLTLSVANLPPVVGYPGNFFLQTLGVDPEALTLNIVVVVIEYAALCLLAVLSLYLRIALKTRGWLS